MREDIDPYGEENWGEEIIDNAPWGNCECGSMGYIINFRRDHWAYCEQCQTRWYVGSNLFSSWKEENEELWQKNRELLITFRIINR